MVRRVLIGDGVPSMTMSMTMTTISTTTTTVVVEYEFKGYLFETKINAQLH